MDYRAKFRTAWVLGLSVDDYNIAREAVEAAHQEDKDRVALSRRRPAPVEDDPPRPIHPTNPAMDGWV